MLGWSINLFRVRGIQLSVHSSFFLLLAWSANDGWKEDRFVGMAWYVGILLAFFVCVVLHEFGHSFTARHFGIGVRRILLMPIGGMAEFTSIPREPHRELLITLAGPAVNFVIAGLIWLFVRPSEGPEYTANVTGLLQLLLHWNLVMGVFNLLPAFPMDGGRILRALLAWKMPYVRATFWAATVGKIVTVIGALFAAFVSHSFLVTVLFIFIFFAGEMEYRAVKQREMEDAHWRELLAQSYLRTPPAEPPLLPR
jgi:Zn-dependent protease